MTDGQDALFGGYEPQVLEQEDGELSADRRRTARQKRLIEQGIHPLAQTVTVPEKGTCGDCVHRVAFGHNSRSYPKCTLPSARPARMTHGAATDCRAWWPACTDHLAFPEGHIRCRHCQQIGPAYDGTTTCEACVMRGFAEGG